MTEPIDTTSSLGRFVMQLLGSIAELERETIMERTRDGRETAVRRGYWPGGKPPMGYRIEHEENQNGSQGRAYLVEEQREADVIRRIFQLYIDDHMSLVSVSAYLNSNDVPTSTAMRTGKPGDWNGARIHAILRNPIYKGEIEFYRRKNKGHREHILGSSPVIVDAEIWEAAQQLLVKNLSLSPRNMKRFYLLRGMSENMARVTMPGITVTGMTVFPPRLSALSRYACKSSTST